jgi:hypothetical protein
MSPLVSVWKSHGETNTMSPSLIQTRLFSLPLILQRRSLPSWHLTMILSAPSIFTAMPKTSFCEGRIKLSRLLSFVTLCLPIFFNSSVANDHFIIRIVWRKSHLWVFSSSKEFQHYINSLSGYIRVCAQKRFFGLKKAKKIRNKPF